MFLALLLPLLTQLPGILGEYFKKRAEIEQAQMELQKEITKAKYQFVAEMAKAEVEDNKNKLLATSSRFKYVTFILWFGPYCIGIVAPELSTKIFANLSQMPDWYVQSCMTIMFTIWGIAVGAPVVSNIFAGLNNFLADRNSRQVNKINALNDKAVFDSLRASFGGLTQPQVDAINKALQKGQE